MKCPACKEPLVALEKEGIEVDWCASCRGVWLDAGELELLHEKPVAARHFVLDLKPCGRSGLAPAHPSRGCPICDKRMTSVESVWDPAIVLDRCPQNDGLWFDRGELVRVLQIQSGSDEVKKFLTGIFAEK